MKSIAQRRQQPKSTNKVVIHSSLEISRCVDCGKFISIAYKIGLLKFCRNCYEKNYSDIRKYDKTTKT